ncbi:MAG TPA: hypothetical protein VI197_21775 [Polyangiaceae bacterium]
MFGDEPAALAPLFKRLVLYPQGYPRTSLGRKVCAELVHYCGGDSQRTFDLKRSTPEQTLDHAARIRAFQDPRRAGLCVVHETTNFETIVLLRAAFEARIPVASSAVWAIYWDPDLDPNFLVRIQEQGVLIGDHCEGATFRHRSGFEFLVFSPFVDDAAKLADEAALMAMARSPKRGQRPSGSQPSVKVQLAS